MDELKVYTQIAEEAARKAVELYTQLDNRIAASAPITEREEQMNAKIRRHVAINGTKVWISANSEQEYVDNVLRIAGVSDTSKTSTPHNFKVYAENWFSVFAKPNITEVTALTYERQLKNHIYPVLGHMNLEEITVADIQKVFNRMGENVKQETKNKVKVVLSQILKMAFEDRIIDRNPMTSPTLKIKGETAETTIPYTVEEMQYLTAHLNYISNPVSKAWLALSIALPLRPEEVLGLRWENLDEENCVLHIRNTVTHPTRNEPVFKTYTKTTSSKRDLQLPKEILAYLPERGEPDEFIIGGAEPVSYTKLRGMRKWITKELNFGATITPRRFRTTVATDISNMTHDLKLVQKMLGHSNPEMTLRYYDKGRSQAVDASDAISKCYGFAES